MDQAAFEKLLDRFTRTAEAGDGEAFAQCFTEDAIYHDYIYGDHVGRPEIAHMMSHLFHGDAGPDYRWEMFDPLVKGDLAYAWSLSSFTSTREEFRGKRVVIENALDLGTREHPDLSVGGPPKGEDVVATLERAREVNGCDPLMIFSDRGPENTATVVRRHVKERMIVHVFSLTHVPEHNARCERSHQDVKAQLGIAACSKGRKLETEDWRERVEDTRCLLNSRMQRRQLGFLTAEEYARALPAWYDGPRGIDRRAFHAACEQAVEDALLGIEDIHERDLAEREAKLRTAERFGLLIRTRGDPLPTRPRYRKELWRFNYSCG